MAFLETHRMGAVSSAQFDEAIKIQRSGVADEFSVLSTYNVGDYVLHDGLLYMCIRAISIVGNWNPLDWEQHKVFDNQWAKVDGGTSSVNI